MQVDNHKLQLAIQRLRSIDWKHDVSRRYSHVALIKEYLRRIALIMEAFQFNTTEIRPFFDFSTEIVPEAYTIQVPDNLRHHETVLVTRICNYYLRWIAIED